MVTAEEALISRDPKEIKRLRGSISTQLTIDINLLEKELSKKTGGSFDLDKMCHQIIKMHKKKLLTHFDLIQKLHERYVELREEGIDELTEDKLVAEDVQYLENIITKIGPVLDNIESYEEVLNDSNKAKNLAKYDEDNKEAVTRAKREFSVVHDKLKAKVEEITATEEGSEKRIELIRLLPVESMIHDLTIAFNGVKKSCNTLKESFRAIQKGEENEKKVAVVTEHEYDSEHSDFIDLNMQLKVFEQAKANTAAPGTSVVAAGETQKCAPLKVNKPDSLKFSGQARDFAPFKRDFMAIIVPGRDDAQVGIHLKQAIPHKHQHLISKDWKSMLTSIEEELATPKIIVDQTVGEIERMKTATSDKNFVEFVDALEKIQRDLLTLDQLSEIANTSVLSKLESKLPSQINYDWTDKVVEEKLSAKTSKEKFTIFMAFLKKAKEKVKYNLSLPSGAARTHCFVTGAVISYKQPEPKDIIKKNVDGKRSGGNILPCLACNIDGATNQDACLHSMSSCMVWANMAHKDRAALVKCIKHPFSKDAHTTQDCNRNVRDCIFCSKNDHNSLLCTKFQVKKKASNNLTKKSVIATSCGESVRQDSVGDLPPTLLYTTFVTTKGGKRVGALMDNGSTDDYILHSLAKKMGLKGVPVVLVTEVFKGTETTESTLLYDVPIYDKMNRAHHLPCYGTDVITSDNPLPDTASYQRMCKQFGVDPEEVRRPKRIELLISNRSEYLYPNGPDYVRICGMKLASGLLGRVFGGTNPDLKFNPIKLACSSKAIQVDNVATAHAKTMKTVVHQATYTTPLRTDREILSFFDEEQIGVQCEPKCGDCKCGTCALGSKQMSIKDEKEYEKFKSLMYLDVEGTEEDPGPYWRTGFPWTIEPSDLVDNKAAVTAVMHTTERKLNKNLEWRKIYELQLRTLIEKGFAKEISEEEIKKKEEQGGKTYYIAHQMALNPQSKTTPVRCCFNSSQRYKGYSLNSCWDLGPNLVNSLHSVLIRFRNNLVGAQGDIAKMYYMVRINDRESWMQIFMWKFLDEEKVRYFKMERLVMGNMPSAGLSGTALSETAKLDDYPVRYPHAHKALTEDNYVDNVFLTASDHEKINTKIAEIEAVAAKGGFFFKPFIISGQKQPDVCIGVVLPDQIGINEEKALGVYWNVTDDTFYIKADLIKASKKVKHGVKSAEVMVDPTLQVSIAPHLTLRVCLSLHSRPFDPLGLARPTKIIGDILFRNTLQHIKKGNKGKIPWDDIIEGILKDKWCEYFSMLVQLDKIYFPRSFKPKNVDDTVKPGFCTFDDGNPDAHGTVGYARWTLKDGSFKCRLILSKSRLCPLTYKAETVRSELAGGVLSARLKSWAQKNADIEWGSFHHFLDAKIVHDMLPKESYGFNTFVGLRVAEIQQKTNYEDWHHVPSKSNIADILTKGAPPNMLGINSEWQNGPAWLSLDESQWPITPRSVTSPDSESVIVQFLKKSKTLTVKSEFLQEKLDILISRCSNLQKLLKLVAWLLRWFLSSRRSSSKALRTGGDTDKTDLGKKVRPISASERDDAMHYLVAWDQKQRLSQKQAEKLVPKTVNVKLNNYNYEVPHTVVGGRIKNFPIGFSGHCADIPILPYSDLSKLVVKYYHYRYHQEVDTIVTHVRNDYWVLKCRKIASSLDSKCVDCKLIRMKHAQQSMGDLPDYRTNIQPAFSVVGLDLWGPIYIKDDVVRRGPRIKKKVWGVLMTCAATRAVYLDVACGNSTEELLHVVRRAQARVGNINTFISDPGTNLMGASKEIKALWESYDKDSLIRFGAEKGIQWITVMAASQHQNGMSEIMIKLAKTVLKSLMKSIGDHLLNLNELNTLLAEAAQLVNERPIGLKPNESVDSAYLSPNSLLLGKNSDRICSGPFLPPGELSDNPASMKTRFLLVQAITDQYWRNWMKIYFPTLVIRQKWHVERRNLKVGDICVIYDRAAIRGEWRMAKVTECYPDSHGKVRNVELMVKPKQSGAGNYVLTQPSHLRRHVSNVVVLVPVEDTVDDEV